MFPTEHQGVHKNSLRNVRAGIWKCWFLRRGENRGTRPEKNISQQSREPSNKLNQHMAPWGPEIEPGTHWWEASVLTTAPSLLPFSNIKFAILANKHRDRCITEDQ